MEQTSKYSNEALISILADGLVSIVVATSDVLEMVDRTPAEFTAEYTQQAVKDLLEEINQVCFDLVLLCGDPCKVLPEGASIFKNKNGSAS